MPPINANKLGALPFAGGIKPADVKDAGIDATGLAALSADKVGIGALNRIFSAKADPAAGMIGRGSGKRIKIGALETGQSLTLGASGRFLIDNKLAGPGPGQGGDAIAIYRAAQLSGANQGLFGDLTMSSAMRGRVLGQLSDAIDFAQSGKSSVSKEKAFAGAVALLIDLARATPKSDTTVKRAIVDTLLQAFAREPDQEQVGFYLQSMRDLFKKMDKVQVKALKTILARIMPRRPPVDAWTENRTKPLVIEHMIHHEFWKEELTFFSKKNGFKLVKKNKKDTERSYVGLIKDPRGIKKPLKIEITVRQGEIDFLDGMSDPKTHVLMYSGHSSLGGNGSEAVQSGGPMKGKHDKLVFVANCRGKDNYAEFTNKYPDAHVIMTEHPTYSVAGQDRVEGLFDTLVRGNTYRYMRSITEYEWWDEPADNYFYPDEWRKFRFMDSDSDGKIDFTGSASDRVFDVDARVSGGKFVRAVNFANSELFYHWEIEHENGLKSQFGKKYGDSLVPDGPLSDAQPGEVVRVIPQAKTLKSKKTAHRFRVRFDPKVAKGMNEDVYAGLVTAHTVMSLAKHKAGALTRKEALRAIVMGGQGIHYMDVYVDHAPKALAQFLRKMGLPKTVKPKDVDHLYEAFDSHGNDAQVAAFETLLSEKFGVDLDKWWSGFQTKHPHLFDAAPLSA